MSAKKPIHKCNSSFANIVKTGKQSKCPSVGELINKLHYNQTTEYYSVLKENELSNHKKT